MGPPRESREHRRLRAISERISPNLARPICRSKRFGPNILCAPVPAMGGTSGRLTGSVADVRRLARSTPEPGGQAWRTWNEGSRGAHDEDGKNRNGPHRPMATCPDREHHCKYNGCSHQPVDELVGCDPVAHASPSLADDVEPGRHGQCLRGGAVPQLTGGR
jgi:hypothetical protein